jgi:hypothetical protein
MTTSLRNIARVFAIEMMIPDINYTI